MTEIQFKEVKFTVPWGQLAAKTYGPIEGKPVLMVHGRLDNAGSFTRLMKYLPIDTFYYVCIDLPGHGWSSHFPSWLALDWMNYVHALHFILEALKWETCIYIGHSMGGQVGLMFSIYQPHKIKKLIVLDAFLQNRSKPNIVTYFKDAFTLSIKTDSNVPRFYTKEEILYGLRTLRIQTLNAEAADALFERAVTEVNGKYKYNRDIRLKNDSFSFMTKDQYIQSIRKLSVPIYLFVATNGILTPYKEEFKLLLNEVNPKIKFQVIYVDGNHDVHNNKPENVGPFIHEILINEDFSKLSSKL